MDDTFFSHPASEELSFTPPPLLSDHQSPLKFTLPLLNSLQNSIGQPSRTHFSHSICPLRTSSNSSSGLYQSKATALSSTPEIGFVEREGQVMQGQGIEVYFSDQSRNQLRGPNPYPCSGRGFEDVGVDRRQANRSLKGLEHFDEDLLESGLVKGSSKREKSSDSSNTPKIPTRNILQYFWKVFKNYFLGKRQPLSQSQAERSRMCSLWQQVTNLKPSLSSFSKLFKNKEMRPFFSQLFRSRFLMREIMGSSLRSSTKITYLRYVKILLKGFLTGELLFLN